MQSVMRFLLKIYNKTEEPKYLNALNKGFNCFEDMEKEGGGWPQTTNFGRNAYEHYTTLNDDAFYDVFMVYVDAYEMFPSESKYLETLKRAGEFLIRVQGNGGSDFQMGWAQQYDDNDQPAWARAFEPYSICSVQTSRAIEMLMELYLLTENTKWLEPIPAAVNWLNSSETKIDSTTWARLYELESNRPIYGLEKGGELQKIPYVYDFEDARPGYSWQNSYGIPETLNKYLKLQEFGNSTDLYLSWRNTPTSIEAQRGATSYADSLLTEDGWWLVDNEIRSTVFNIHSGWMVDYLTAVIA